VRRGLGGVDRDMGLERVSGIGGLPGRWVRVCPRDLPGVFRD
jgi:hypothetical protein